MMTELETRTIEILRGYGDPACYAQMTQAILRGEAEILELRADGVLTRHRMEGFYMLAGDVQTMMALLERIPKDACEVLLHGELAPETIERAKTALGMKDVQPYVMYMYDGELPPEETQVQIRPLGLDALDFLYENYGHASREYLGMLLEKGVMIGAYVDGEMAGFIGEHAAGAMGLLHVMPEYRRHHLGFALERADIRRIMLDGHLPFCQVAPDNTASNRLQERLGMTPAKGRMYWMSRND